MITYKQGNLLDDDAECLINCVNCVGVAGRGIALAFKKRFPRNFRYYREQCLAGRLKPGYVLPCSDGMRMLLNVATKDHWRDPSRLVWIRVILQELAWYLPGKVASVAVPALGCGNGGLAWRDVKPLIEQSMNLAEVDVRVYLPWKM